MFNGIQPPYMEVSPVISTLNVLHRGGEAFNDNIVRTIPKVIQLAEWSQLTTIKHHNSYTTDCYYNSCDIILQVQKTMKLKDEVGM